MHAPPFSGASSHQSLTSVAAPHSGQAKSSGFGRQFSFTCAA